MDPNALFKDLNSTYSPLLIGILLLALLAQILKSSTVKGWWGERQVRFVLHRLDPAHYRCFHDLYLPRTDGQGTTQIDHVIASIYGVFVIETKNYQGWIFGSENQPNWTQRIYKRKERFQNPLRQNQLHLNALKAFLQLPEHRFLSAVVFVGSATFKTDMPANVLQFGNLLRWIKSHHQPNLTPAELDQAIERLTTLDATTHRPTAAKNHRANLANRNR
jgi:restriction system protein